MSNNNEGELRKKCPFNGTWCIGEACACSVKVTKTQMVLGVMRQMTGDMCSLPALCDIMSSVPSQLAQVMAQRPVKIPPIFKG